MPLSPKRLHTLCSIHNPRELRRHIVAPSIGNMMRLSGRQVVQFHLLYYQCCISQCTHTHTPWQFYRPLSIHRMLIVSFVGVRCAYAGKTFSHGYAHQLSCRYVHRKINYNEKWWRNINNTRGGSRPVPSMHLHRSTKYVHRLICFCIGQIISTAWLIKWLYYSWFPDWTLSGKVQSTRAQLAASLQLLFEGGVVWIWRAAHMYG